MHGTVSIPASDNPEEVTEAVTALVRRSLHQEERELLAEDESLLKRLEELLEKQLAVLAGFGENGPEAQPPEKVAQHEAAGAACLKLARNLSAGRPEMQGRWWRRGLIERLAVQARSDVASPGGERSPAWCEAVPSFVANAVAGNPELRAEALSALYPYGLAALLALCWRRPDHGFLLLQNLFAAGDAGCKSLASVERFVEEPCVLYVALSLLRAVDADDLSTSVAAKARDWAAIFFSSLWTSGLFAEIFRAVASVPAARLHSFLTAVAAVPGWGALCPQNDGEAPGSQAAAATTFGLITSRLCGHKEALGLLWHTVRGLLGGLDSEAEAVDKGGDSSASALRLAQQLLNDPSFVELAAQEMASAIMDLAARWGLELDYSPPPEDACHVLGLQPEDLDLAALAAHRLHPEEVPCSQEAGEEGAFRELLLAAVELAGIPCGSPFPQRLAGLYLSANVQLLKALHHLRFGTAAVAEVGAELPSRKELTSSNPEAVKAATACQLVAQLRLCGNVLYESPEAAEFLRLSGGLPILLSHCYADPEMPLLREVGVFAVRNATQHSEQTRAAVKVLLAERRARSASNAQSQGAELPVIDETALF